METVNVPSGLEVESASWRSKLSPRLTRMKSKVNGQLRAKPAVFAGIAAGLGFALGLTGRIARHRREARKQLPALLVIEGC